MQYQATKKLTLNFLNATKYKMLVQDISLHLGAWLYYVLITFMNLFSY